MRLLLLSLSLLACFPPAPPKEPPPGSLSCDDWERSEAVGQVASKDLDEISGIAVSRKNPGVLWVHEDSGNEPILFALSLSGELLGSLRLEGVANIDWEDIAISPCGASDCLFVGDFGDNKAAREDVSILRIEEPLLSGGPFEESVTPEIFPFQYPGGPQDAESLAVTPEGLPIIVTKRLDGTAGLFLLPALDEAARTPLLFLGELSTTEGNTGLVAAATAADLSPDGSRLLVRTYLFGWEFRFPPKARSEGRGERKERPEGGEETEAFFSHSSLLSPLSSLSGQPTRVEAPVAFELQGEAIAYDPLRKGFWQVGEGQNPTLHFASCLRL